MVITKIPKRYVFIISTALFAIAGYIDVLIFPTGGNTAVLLSFFGFSILLLVLSLLTATTKIKTLLKVISVPLVYVLSVYLLLFYFPNLNTLFKISFVSFAAFVLYFLLLSINIFLVVHEKGSVIPLVRPAKTAFLLLQVFILFLFYTAIYKVLLPEPITELTFIFQTFVISLASYLFAEQYWWSQGLEDEITSFVGQESVVIAFLLFMFSVSLSFLESEAFFRSLALTAVFYVSINFFKAVVTHRFSKGLLVEFSFVGIISAFFFLLG